MSHKTVYLAASYANAPNKQARLDELREACLSLLKAGFAPYCPLINSVYSTDSYTAHSEVFGEWYKALEPGFVQACDYIAVYITPDVLFSEGVRRELYMAQQANKPIIWILKDGNNMLLIEACKQGSHPDEEEQPEAEEEEVEECQSLEEKLDQQEKSLMDYISLGKLLGKKKTE